MKSTPKPRASTVRRLAAERTHAERRLVALYATAEPSTIADGRSWYAEAAAEVARIATPSVPQDRAAAIVAALSPRTKWRRNLHLAAEVVAGRPIVGLGKSIAKAEAIRDGAELTGEPGDALGGDAPKIRAFWRNITGDASAVTLDVWATRAATGGKREAPASTADYENLAAAYRAAAAKVGERAADFQAIIWLTIRPSGEHARDKQHLAKVRTA